MKAFMKGVDTWRRETTLMKVTVILGLILINGTCIHILEMLMGDVLVV